MTRAKLTRVKRTNPRLLAIFVVAAITLAAVAAARAADAPEPRVEIIKPDGTYLAVIKVEIAANDASREIGLMYRKSLGANDGMLFVFKQPSHQGFWMKNTEIPLDMIFAGASGKIVGIVADATPYSEKLLSVAADSQYVLEVNGGFAKSHHIAAGDMMKFAGFDPHKAE
jgi:uncharacterized membrane protein (UPF0127 family)